MNTFIRYWIPVLLVASGIFYLSSLPASDIPQIDFPFLDKIVHLSLYASLSFVFCRALTLKFRRHPQDVELKPTIMICIAFAIFYGITDEFHQSFTPGRAVEFWDVVADAVGGFTGAILGLFYRRKVAEHI